MEGRRYLCFIPPFLYGRREYEMSEMAVNGNTGMYDEVMEVNKLNKVEGFDPRKYMRLILNEGQPGKYYLDVAYRKLWFRLKYPQGKIVKKLVKLTEQVAIAEARIYLDKNDAEDNFISNALAQKYQSNDDPFGNKYVELAETAAVGRALSDAGFGLQFADKEKDFDPEVTESPIDPQIMHGGSLIPEETLMGENDRTVMEPEEGGNIPGQHSIEEYIPMPEEIEEAMQGMPPVMQTQSSIQGGTKQTVSQGKRTQNGTVPSAQQAAGGQKAKAAPNSQPAKPAKTSVQSNQAEQQDQNKPAIRKDMPVEEIYQMLNRETAAAVVVSIGFNKGKTLGQIAVEKPNSLEWYVTSYGGPDNLLRAAAKFLIDTALAQAG